MNILSSGSSFARRLALSFTIAFLALQLFPATVGGDATETAYRSADARGTARRAKLTDAWDQFDGKVHFAYFPEYAYWEKPLEDRPREQDSGFRGP